MHDEQSQDTFGGMSSLTSEPPLSAWTPEVPQWVAVVSIVIGVLGMLCWGGQGAMALGMAGMDHAEDMPMPTGGHAAFEMFGYGSATLLGLWLIIAGSGAASGAEWGRGALRSWAWIRILLAIIGLVGAFYWFSNVLEASMDYVEQQMAEAAAEDAPPAEIPAVTESAVRAKKTVWIVVMSVAICVWPAVVLIVTRRRGAS
jgi:hypothetical protein